MASAPRTALLLGLALSAAAGTLEGPCAEGLRFFVEERYQEAQHAFERALETDPDNADCLVWLGRAYGRRAERTSRLKFLSAISLAKKSRRSFERAAEIDPRNLAALESLIDFYVDAPGIVGGGVGKAEALAARAAKINPARGARLRAQILRAKKEYAAAERALGEAIALEPEEIDHLLSRAAFLSSRGRFEESDRLFAKAFEREPDSPRVWFSRADALVKAKRRTEEARRLLERYLKTDLYAPDAEPYSEARKLLEKIQ